jgi:hypothetical protein
MSTSQYDNVLLLFFYVHKEDCHYKSTSLSVHQIHTEYIQLIELRASTVRAVLIHNVPLVQSEIWAHTYIVCGHEETWAIDMRTHKKKPNGITLYLLLPSNQRSWETNIFQGR